MIRRTCVCLVSTILLSGCQRSEAPVVAKPKPAQVAHEIGEESLNTIILVQQAHDRLDIQLAEVQVNEVPRKRTYGGEVVVPPGGTLTVSAPLAGTLSPPPQGAVPLPGSKLEQGQAIFSWTPLLTPEREVLTPADRIRVAQTKADVATAQIEAERQVASAKIQVEAAQLAYDRAVKLLNTMAGSQRTVDETHAQLRLASEALATAILRNDLLAGIKLDEEPGELSPRTVTAPVSGVLQSLDVATGETVAAGQILFQVVTTRSLWIRFPVYVGQWREIDMSADVEYHEYGNQAGPLLHTARFASAPPSADPMAATVDLFVEVANDDGRLYPGQRVAVITELKSRAPSRTVPRAAVLYDIHGGSWVYEEVAPLTYVRRRVEVAYIAGPLAVITKGPPAGTKVVTDGAAELFGTEFGVGK